MGRHLLPGLRDPRPRPTGELNARLRDLALEPTQDAVLDQATGWWTTTYANHTGLVRYGISERHRHIVILRLQDLS